MRRFQAHFQAASMPLMRRFIVFWGWVKAYDWKRNRELILLIRDLEFPDPTPKQISYFLSRCRENGPEFPLLLRSKFWSAVATPFRHAAAPNWVGETWRSPHYLMLLRPPVRLSTSACRLSISSIRLKTRWTSSGSMRRSQHGDRPGVLRPSTKWPKLAWPEEVTRIRAR